MELQVHIDALPASNVEILLDSIFEDAEALEDYQKDPVHVAVAETYVKPYIRTRNCMDLAV